MSRNNKAMLSVLAAPLIAACVASGEVATPHFTTRNDTTVFKIETTNEAGVFYAVLRNDRSLLSPQLYESFKGLIQTYCGTNSDFVFLEDAVVLIDHEARPQSAIKNKFRCEMRQQ
jgi:hypothetical protein